MRRNSLSCGKPTKARFPCHPQLPAAGSRATNVLRPQSPGLSAEVFQLHTRPDFNTLNFRPSREIETEEVAKNDFGRQRLVTDARRFALSLLGQISDDDVATLTLCPAIHHPPDNNCQRVFFSKQSIWNCDHVIEEHALHSQLASSMTRRTLFKEHRETKFNK
ncbi:hypothetical protein L596_003395 [Steinernema carpocapsae]|uniref:Uncharacterized protein n=1 Tax=Steinernema carpocapsae TaxID=34508 RepID=A0A4U8UTF4_STECR|nr:hypothetical protein L596_003395 [Steinernema carpocapsae]